jgi:hypothetical protein
MGYAIAANGCGKPVHCRQSRALVTITDEQLPGREKYRAEKQGRMARFMRAGDSPRAPPGDVVLPSMADTSSSSLAGPVGILEDGSSMSSSGRCCRSSSNAAAGGRSSRSTRTDLV